MMADHWADAWHAATGESPPRVAFSIIHDISAARREPRHADDYQRRVWIRKQQEHRKRTAELAEHDVCRAVERALDSGTTWTPEVADAVAAVRVARAWEPCGYYDADDIDAFLASDLSLDDFLDSRLVGA